MHHGADPNQKDVVGNTPLHLAVCASRLEMVITLLQNGANCASLDNSGRSPLSLARSKLSLLSRSMSASPAVGSSTPLASFKMEAMKISLMLGIYLDKCNQQGGLEARKSQIDDFSERVAARQTNQEVEQDVNDLLECLEHWSL